MSLNSTNDIRPITGASILVVNGDKALIIKRGKEPSKGLWALPGGRQEPGEILEETARRELLEETGLTGKNLRLLQMIEPMKRDENEKLISHYVLAVYFCNDATGRLCAGDDAAEATWVGLEQLDDYEFTGTSRQIIEHFLPPERPLSITKK